MLTALVSFWLRCGPHPMGDCTRANCDDGHERARRGSRIQPPLQGTRRGPILRDVDRAGARSPTTARSEKIALSRASMIRQGIGQCHDRPLPPPRDSRRTDVPAILRWGGRIRRDGMTPNGRQREKSSNIVWVSCYSRAPVLQVVRKPRACGGDARGRTGLLATGRV